MLRANVGLSRKVSRDYQSTGYSVNIDTEIPIGLDDAQGILEKVHEAFNLAEEALNREIDRDQSEAAIGRRDEQQPPPNNAVRSQPVSTGTSNGGSQTNGGQLITNKQAAFIHNLGNRLQLSKSDLEGRITAVIGRKCGVYELTKREAGQVIDTLTAGSGNGRRS